jgi:hypothetical protein
MILQESVPRLLLNSEINFGLQMQAQQGFRGGRGKFYGFRQKALHAGPLAAALGGKASSCCLSIAAADFCAKVFKKIYQAIIK